MSFWAVVFKAIFLSLLQVVHLRVPMKNEDDVRKVVAALQIKGTVLLLFTILSCNRAMKQSLVVYSQFSKT